MSNDREKFTVSASEVGKLEALAFFEGTKSVADLTTMPTANKWDLRFLELAKLVSTWSKDPSTQTGAVIVRPDKSVASVGFNGFPKRMRDDEELYNNRESKYSRVVHCEVNALLFAREPFIRPENARYGYSLYTFPFASCDRCCVQMIQAGITRFVFPALPADKRERWEKSMNLTKSYIEEARLEWTEVE